MADLKSVRQLRVLWPTEIEQFVRSMRATNFDNTTAEAMGHSPMERNERVTALRKKSGGNRVHLQAFINLRLRSGDVHRATTQVALKATNINELCY